MGKKADRLREDLDAAEEDISELQKLMVARNAREIAAGDKCGVSWAEHLERWPDAVAEEILRLNNSIFGMKKFVAENGEIKVDWEGHALPAISRLVAAPFIEGPGVNFMEWTVNHEKTGPMLITIQRTEGKTPAQLRTEAIAEKDAVFARLTEARDLLRRIMVVDGQANGGLLQEIADFLAESSRCPC